VFGSVRDDAGRAGLGTEVPGHRTPEAVPFDVTDEAGVRQGVEAVLDRAGTIDVLVNNAGIAPAGPVETATDDDWRRAFEVNVLGAVRVIRAVLPSMRAAGAGVIVNVSSINGRFAAPFMGAYSASKFGLEAMSEALRYEVEDQGIRVVVVEPGQFDTPIFGKMRSLPEPAADSPYATAELAMRRSSPRAGQAADPAIAAAVILEAVDGRRAGFRHPAGQDGELYLRTRAELPDDEWFALVKAFQPEP
jgi:NAD(P)-dependent dehydrogenase (short-subunit alcohol dehydrogenase family)